MKYTLDSKGNLRITDETEDTPATKETKVSGLDIFKGFVIAGIIIFLMIKFIPWIIMQYVLGVLYAGISIFFALVIYYADDDLTNFIYFLIKAIVTGGFYFLMHKMGNTSTVLLSIAAVCSCAETGIIYLYGLRNSNGGKVSTFLAVAVFIADIVLFRTVRAM